MMFPDYDLNPPPDDDEKQRATVTKILVFITALFWILFLIGWFLLSSVFPAKAHDAETGWKYPFSCCSNYDCRIVNDPAHPSPVRIIKVPGGWKISTTGEVIRYGDKSLRVAPDNHWHWCSASGRDDTKTICLWMPDSGI